LTDEQLVGQYLKGDEGALEILIRRYFKRVFGFLARFVGNNKEAEDLTQETFLKAWKGLKKFDQTKNFSVWLFRIARNAGIDHLRRKKMLVFSDLDNEKDEERFVDKIPDDGESLFEKAEKDDLAKEISGYLSKLSENNRSVVLLRYNQQMSFSQIADLLEETLDTVKSRHRRALIYLKRYIGASAPKKSR